MLNNYLETNIRNKLNLLSILDMHNPISGKELREKLRLSISGMTALIEDLNEDLSKFGKITKKSSVYIFSANADFNIIQLFKEICTSSNVLQCLKFMLLNDTKQPFSDFIENEYLTKSSAYRIRRNCLEYLRCIGLDVKDNYVVGEEYRIRFLIGLLHHKYGIDCYPLDDSSLQVIRNFVLASNEMIDYNYLEQTVQEYGYFEYLVFLSWKRQAYPISPEVSERIDPYKDFFIYKYIQEAVLHYIEPAVGVKFTQLDYDYIFLVYCCTFNCLFSNHWTYERGKSLHKIAFADSYLADLLNRFTKVLGEEVTSIAAFRTTLIYFYKKCFLELYCIIPDTNFFIEPKKGQLTLAVVDIISDIFKEWQEANNLKYPIDKHHIIYLALQIEFILRQFMPPINLLLLTDMNAELQVLNLYFNRNFSSEKIEIVPILLNLVSKDFLLKQKDSVIIVHKKFESIVYNLGLAENNIVIPITVEINDDAVDTIRRAITYFERKKFMDIIKRDQQKI